MTMLDTQALRDEAAQEPDPVHTGEVTSETQVIAAVLARALPCLTSAT